MDSDELKQLRIEKNQSLLQKWSAIDPIEKSLAYYPCKEETPIMNRRRKKSTPRLSLDDKLTIIRSVIIENKDYLFVSK